MEGYLIVYGVLLLVLLFFLFSSLSYGIITLIALLFLVLIGIISPENLFSGFAHPAVWMVIFVLIITRGLINSGLINVLSQKLNLAGKTSKKQIKVFSLISGIFSAFMNNVGALASLIPIVKNVNKDKKENISKILIPMAFASLLGGMLTMIGTAPNIIVSIFREEITGKPFRIFDFFPVGIILAVVGISFMSFFGWKLVPKRKSLDENKTEIENYKTEIKVPKTSKYLGRSLRTLLRVSNSKLKFLSVIHKGRLKNKPSIRTKIKQGDILIVQGKSSDISLLVDIAGLEYANSEKLRMFSEEEHIVEAMISSGSPLINKKLKTVLAHKRYKIKILSVAPYKTKNINRVSETVVKEGDIIILQGTEENIKKALNDLKCKTLEEKNLRFGQSPRIITAFSILTLTILSASFNVVPVEIAFMFGAILMILTKLTSIKESYSESIDWPIILLLGAMFPIGMALNATGGTTATVHFLLNLIGELPVWAILLSIMGITMLFSNILNNAATTVLMVPFALGITKSLSLSLDPFLMGIAIAASCPFLTPIGHQSCLLVMNEGGYKFGDYWKAGIILSLLVLLLSVPLILYFWPA